MTQLELPAGMERLRPQLGAIVAGMERQVPYAAALLSQRSGLGIRVDSREERVEEQPRSAGVVLTAFDGATLHEAAAGGFDVAAVEREGARPAAAGVGQARPRHRPRARAQGRFCYKHGRSARVAVDAREARPLPGAPEAAGRARSPDRQRGGELRRSGRVVDLRQPGRRPGAARPAHPHVPVRGRGGRGRRALQLPAPRRHGRLGAARRDRRGAGKLREHRGGAADRRAHRAGRIHGRRVAVGHRHAGPRIVRSRRRDRHVPQGAREGRAVYRQGGGVAARQHLGRSILPRRLRLILLRRRRHARRPDADRGKRHVSPGHHRPLLGHHARHSPLGQRAPAGLHPQGVCPHDQHGARRRGRRAFRTSSARWRTASTWRCGRRAWKTRRAGASR